MRYVILYSLFVYVFLFYSYILPPLYWHCIHAIIRNSVIVLKFCIEMCMHDIFFYIAHSANALLLLLTLLLTIRPTCVYIILQPVTASVLVWVLPLEASLEVSC